MGVDGKVAILDYGSGFNGDFTGRESVYLKGALFGLSKKQIDERFQSIEDFADIGEFIDQPVKTYSSGMGARLGFAIMAHVDAEILITDEALAVGDAFFVQKCMRHIRSFLETGTFLFVSHSINDVLSLCQKAVWLEHGVVKAIGSAQAVTNAYLGTRALARASNAKVDAGDKQEDIQLDEDKTSGMPAGIFLVRSCMRAATTTPSCCGPTEQMHHYLHGHIFGAHMQAFYHNMKILEESGIDRITVLLRDPRDAFVSWVHHLKNLGLPARN